MLKKLKVIVAMKMQPQIQQLKNRSVAVRNAVEILVNFSLFSRLDKIRSSTVKFQSLLRANFLKISSRFRLRTFCERKNRRVISCCITFFVISRLTKLLLCLVQLFSFIPILEPFCGPTSDNLNTG